MNNPDGEPLVSQFVGDISEVIDKYRDQGLTVSEAIGALEIVKLDIWHSEMEDDRDESL